MGTEPEFKSEPFTRAPGHDQLPEHRGYGSEKVNGRYPNRREFRRILLIRLKSIGDIVFTVPAVAAVRASFPDAELAFAVSKEHAGLLRGFVGIHHVITVDRAALRSGNPMRAIREVWRVMAFLRKRRFDLAIDFQGYGETALMTRWTGASRRCGAVHGGARQWAYTRTVKRCDGVHPAELNLEVARASGAAVDQVQNLFVAPAEAIQEARELMVNAGVTTEKPVLCIQPFTSTAEKNWPLESYLEVARRWRERGGETVFVCGRSEGERFSQASRSSRGELRTTEGFMIVAGAPLLTAAAVLGQASAVLGGDTGLMHVAVAMGKRVLMLMNWAGPGNSYPFGHRDWALVPEPRQGLASLEVDKVWRSVELACASIVASK